jgi:hypothetical protein
MPNGRARRVPGPYDPGIKGYPRLTGFFVFARSSQTSPSGAGAFLSRLARCTCSGHVRHRPRISPVGSKSEVSFMIRSCATMSLSNSLVLLDPTWPQLKRHDPLQAHLDPDVVGVGLLHLPFSPEHEQFAGSPGPRLVRISNPSISP